MAHDEADVDWGDPPEDDAVIESMSRTTVELTPRVEVEARSAARGKDSVAQPGAASRTRKKKDTKL